MRPRFEPIELPVEEITVRYRAGESTSTLGCAYDVGRITIGRRLRAAGVKMRPRGAPQGNQYGRGKAGWHKRGGPLCDCHGYLQTKNREGKNCSVHRGCWEAYHGPIPSGHDVHHLDDDQQHNAIGNLACMPHGEHMRMHGTQRG